MTEIWIAGTPTAVSLAALVLPLIVVWYGIEPWPFGRVHRAGGSRSALMAAWALVLSLAPACSPAATIPAGEPGGAAQTEPEVPVQDRFGSTIVYGVNPSVPLERLRADCERRGGTLNTCGSPCAPGAEVCAQVCAVTCEGTRTPGDGAAHRR